MLIEKVHPRLFEDGLGFLLGPVVGRRDQPPDGIEPVANLLALAQVIDGEIAFIRE